MIDDPLRRERSGCCTRHTHADAMQCQTNPPHHARRNLLRAKIEPIVRPKNGLQHIMLHIFANIVVIRLRSATGDGVCAIVCVCAMRCIHKSSCQLLFTIWIDSQSHVSVCTLAHTCTLFTTVTCGILGKYVRKVRCVHPNPANNERVNLSNAKIERFSPILPYFLCAAGLERTKQARKSAVNCLWRIACATATQRGLTSLCFLG